MEYGICTQSAIAMRKENSHASEMVSQLLYNELYVKLDKKSEWILIRTELDQYEGWIPAKQHHPINENEFLQLKDSKLLIVNQPVANYKGRIVSFGTPLFEPAECAAEMPQAFQPQAMIDNARKLLGAPYLWGGRTVMGIDCSGFVQLCARSAGLLLPRDASQQIQCGEVVYFLQETQPGDLAFFGNENGTITHVGIIIGNEQIIHASGEVRIDYLDQTGIFNKETGIHTHQLVGVKRMI
ncbi:MAG: C40 family peptidase [Bacteroidales bacterium]|nr:C40 family peptidase [Bacteroidales bacterium]